MPIPPQTRHPEECANAVAALFGDVFGMIGLWRDAVAAAVGAGTTVAAVDELVSALVLPELSRDDPLLIGAGFIAAPEKAPENAAGNTHAPEATFAPGDPSAPGPAPEERGVHFAWWLGPLDAGPIFGSTTGPSRLDLTTRGYVDYVRDVSTLEWYATPAATHATHVTGPYVDHLCTCDYILTLTMPAHVDGRLIGVVGADIAVQRLERAVLPTLLAYDEPLAVVNASGRVIVSSAPDAQPGTLLTNRADGAACAGTPLSVLHVTESSQTG